MLYRTKIAGVGSFLPDNVVTNDDLSKIIDTNDEWIQERSGIKERRHILKGTYGDKPVAHMGVEAAKIALERASIDKDDIEGVVGAKAANAIASACSGNVNIQAGGGGVYGKISVG